MRIRRQRERDERTLRALVELQDVLDTPRRRLVPLSDPRLVQRMRNTGVSNRYPVAKGRLSPMDPRIREVKVAGIGGKDFERFVSENITGPQTIAGGLARGGKTLVEPAVRDAFALPANVVTGLYYTGRAGYKAVPIPGVKKSDTREAEQLWKDFKETDPIALAAQGRWHEAGQAAAAHPLLTALEVAGPAAGISRGAGVAARSRVMPRRVREAASTRRPERRVEGTNIVETRRYRRGLAGRAVQRGAETYRGRRVRRLTARADEAEALGRLPQADQLRRKALRTDPERVPDRQIAHQVDVAVEGLNQSIRRPGRAETASQIRKLLPRRGGELVSLLTQRIARADPEDLRAYLRELEDEATRLEGSAKAKANRRMRAQIEKALRTRKVDLDDLERAAREYVGVVKPLEDEVVAAGMLAAPEAEMAKLKPYAVRYMGARDALLGDEPNPRLVVPKPGRKGKRAAGALAPGAWVRAGDRENVGRIESIRGDRASVRFVNRESGAEATVVLPLSSLRVEGGRVAPEDFRTLTAEDIKAHMRSPAGPGRIDPENVAFVSHAPGRLGDRAFNVSSRKAPGIPQTRRTGSAVREGLLDLDPERLVEQGVQLRGMADANRSWKRFIGTFAFRDKGGRVEHSDRGEAQRLANDLAAETGREWRVIRLSPWAGRREQLGKLLEEADAEGFIGGGKHPISEAIEGAVKEQGDDSTGPYAIVPEAAAERLMEHAQVYRSTGPLARTVTQAFRRTVLPLSPSWLTGNVVESAMRTAIAGAGPRDWLAFRRTYNELATGDGSIVQALRRLPEPRRGSPEEQLLHMVPGGHFGGTHDTMVRVSARQFEGKRLEPIADAMAAIYRNPGPGTLARGYRRYTDWMFGTFNAAIEAQFTRTLAGKHIRRELMDRDSRRSVETAIQQAARGARNTPEQIAMADFVRRAYGQYDSLSPVMRRGILTYTPFGMWTWNATKFLFNVLPRDHPMLTAVLAANHQLSEDWRKAQGLDFWAENAVPPFLQGSIPLPGGGHLRAARYTPFGLMGNPLESVAGIVLPQYSGSLMTFRGLDWKGDPLRGPDGEQETDPIKLALLAAKEFAYASTPGLALGARLIEKGPSTLNPFNPVKPLEEGGGGRPPSAREVLDRAKRDEAPSAAEVLRKLRGK